MKKLIKNFLLYFNYWKSKKVDISTRAIPCVDCGACCNYFKIGFDYKRNSQVPFEKITFIKKESYMKGGENFKGRCVGLQGTIGKDAKCSIYKQRPDVCAAFPVWLDNGNQNPRCIKAREFHGLKGEIEY